MPDSTNRPTVELTTASASAICAAARRAAAAGLFSSCARPAAIVPSAARRSRFCSRPVIRLITGAICCITRRCTAGCTSARRRKSSDGISARTHADSVVTVTPNGASVSTAIAPIQVGATWRPTGSARSPSNICASAVPSSSSSTPGTSLACSAITVPGSTSRTDVASTHSTSSSSSRSSKRSTVRRSAAVAGRLMARRGTGG